MLILHGPFLINIIIFKNSEWIYNFFEEMTYLLCCSSIALMSTAWVLFQLKYKTKKSSAGKPTMRMGNTLDRNRTISKSHLSKNKKKKQKQLRKSSKSTDDKERINSVTPKDDGNGDTEFGSDESRTATSFVAEKFNFVLSTESQFELFMSHIKQEFSLENMLALIEFCQYEDLIIEQMDQMDNRK
eukprot:96761_1